MPQLSNDDTPLTARMTITLSGPGGEHTRSVALGHHQIDALCKELTSHIYFNGATWSKTVGEEAIEAGIHNKPKPKPRAPRLTAGAKGKKPPAKKKSAVKATSANARNTET